MNTAEIKPLKEFRGKGVTAELEKKVEEMARRLCKLEADLIALRARPVDLKECANVAIRAFEAALK